MSLNELTPKEVLTIYLMNKEQLDRYEDLFETNTIVENVEVSETSMLSVKYTLTEETVDQIKNSIHYLFVVNLDKKLSAIAAVIMDVEKDLYDEIIDSLKKQI